MAIGRLRYDDYLWPLVVMITSLSCRAPSASCRFCRTCICLKGALANISSWFFCTTCFTASVQLALHHKTSYWEEICRCKSLKKVADNYDYNLMVYAYWDGWRRGWLGCDSWVFMDPTSKCQTLSGSNAELKWGRESFQKGKCTQTEPK